MITACVAFLVASAQVSTSAEAHRPSLWPDRIILTWSGDPATTQSVTWRTVTGVTSSQAQIAVAEDGPLFVPRAKTITGESEPFENGVGSVRNHSVTFRDLRPGTKYVYRVGDGTNWSEWIHFTTARVEAAPFSFIYFGDAQNDIRSHWSRVIREAFSDAPKASFIIHAGDLIDTANNDVQWGEWFGAGGWLNAMVPSIPSPGNHEYARNPADASAPRTLSRHWRPQFTLPGNGVAGLEETNYYIDYQGARIISLDSNRMLEEQALWLDALLAKGRPNWVIVTFHHPVFSAAKDRDNPRIRELWKPVFDRHRVDLVLQGHDHTYARGHYTNMPNGAAARTKEGTMYVVSVSGPKMYNLEREDWMARAAEDTQLYQIIHVAPDRIRYEAKTASGRAYDGFELEKRRGRPNRLIDRKPNTPENRRTAPQKED